MKCRKCKQLMNLMVEDHRYLESGLDNVILRQIDTFRCDCGEKVVGIPKMPELNALIGKTLAEKKSSLKGKEIRYLRKNMGFTAKKLSEIMGIDNATISRWEADLQKPAKTHDHFFRLLYLTEKRVPVDQVKQIVESIFPEIDSQTSDSLDMVLTPEPWNSTSY